MDTAIIISAISVSAALVFGIISQTRAAQKSHKESEAEAKARGAAEQKVQDSLGRLEGTVKEILEELKDYKKILNDHGERIFALENGAVHSAQDFLDIKTRVEKLEEKAK